MLEFFQSPRDLTKVISLGLFFATNFLNVIDSGIKKGARGTDSFFKITY